MRSWNHHEITQKFGGKQSCEPTYEELKPKSTTYDRLPEISCEPTYEELKPENAKLNAIVIDSLRAYLWGVETTHTQVRLSPATRCEPTYEELKPPVGGWGNKKIKVASLPMRSWNSGYSTSVRTTPSLRAYLWGVETLEG